jgi:hypothetical protein
VVEEGDVLRVGENGKVEANVPVRESAPRTAMGSGEDSTHSAVSAISSGEDEKSG